MQLGFLGLMFRQRLYTPICRGRPILGRGLFLLMLGVVFLLGLAGAHRLLLYLLHYVDHHRAILLSLSAPVFYGLIVIGGSWYGIKILVWEESHAFFEVLLTSTFHLFGLVVVLGGKKFR